MSDIITPEDKPETKPEAAASGPAEAPPEDKAENTPNPCDKGSEAENASAAVEHMASDSRATEGSEVCSVSGNADTSQEKVNGNSIRQSNVNFDFFKLYTNFEVIETKKDIFMAQTTQNSEGLNKKLEENIYFLQLEIKNLKSEIYDLKSDMRNMLFSISKIEVNSTVTIFLIIGFIVAFALVTF